MLADVAPSGVVTFLFTDIEGSTRRWESDADAMRAALTLHDEVLRTAVEGNDGFLFKCTGDGIVAAFASPSSAVVAAADAQRALALPVRMGIATGEAQQRDGDYFGTVLNRAARVMSAGHGGQVLVADSTAALLKGIDLINLGPRWLRDVPDPITLFQLRVPGLRTEFPPLKTLPVNQGNLRPQTSGLIGRKSVIIELEAAVRTHRLVTLTGVGGVGKTRLALEIASQLSNEFPDGVWIFELAAVIDSAAVPDAVATVLGITQQAGTTVTDSIAGALEGQNKLLVFDNCEHVLDAVAELLEAILARSATLTILATSREGVGVADEQLWPVHSLDLDACVDLFVERARRVSPTFALDDRTPVIRICERLDGIPLAIELAASRVSSMGVDDIGRRLAHRFKFLTGSRRGEKRHQTLREAVAWSYDLLDGAEKTLLERCSVFCGGFDLESACAIAGFDEEDEYEVLDRLDALVRKSLLVIDRSGLVTRFSMLETIRQFAHDQLAEHGADEETHGTHARIFAGREAGLLALWDGPRQREAYNRFEVEFANLRAAFRWAADHRDLDTAVGIACYAAFLGPLLEQYEPVAWAGEILAEATASGHRRLAQLYTGAAQCYVIGRFDDAVGYLDAAYDTERNPDFEPIPHGTLASLAFVYAMAGRPERWLEVCRSPLDDHDGSRIAARASAAMALRIMMNDEAVTAAEGLLADAERTDNPHRACYALMAHGTANSDRAQYAHDVLTRALIVAQDSGNRQLESAVATLLCMVAAVADDLLLGVADSDPSDAMRDLKDVIRRYQDAGSVALLYTPLAVLAIVFDAVGEHEQAATIFGFVAKSTSTAHHQKNLDAIAHLRTTLGDETFASLGRAGEEMTAAQMVAYAFDHIDRVVTCSSPQ